MKHCRHGGHAVRAVIMNHLANKGIPAGGDTPTPVLDLINTPHTEVGTFGMY